MKINVTNEAEWIDLIAGTALEIEGKLVAHCSTYRLRDNRTCDPQGPVAAFGDREPRTALLGSSFKNQKCQFDSPLFFCTTLALMAHAIE